MVRLEAKSGNKGCSTNFNFNSKMVRLEGQEVLNRQLSPRLFQFQNGTIRSLNQGIRVALQTLISIPKWYD